VPNARNYGQLNRPSSFQHISMIGPSESALAKFLFPMAKAVAENLGENKGIAVCGSGQGEAMAANKVRGIRAAVVYDEYSARMSRQDNDANIMALGARTLDIETAKRLVRMWLETPFSGEERHIRRIKKIAEEEKT